MKGHADPNDEKQKGGTNNGQSIDSQNQYQAVPISGKES